MKVIFHINELNKWKMVLNNVENLLKADTQAMVEVLANGDAVKYYLEKNEEIIFLMNKRIQFIACMNSLKARQIKIEDLIKGVKVVPVGVYELAQKQQEGYAYIKP